MSQSWTTRDELEFLDTIAKKNLAAFRGYKAGFHLRRNWGAIDRRAIASRLGVSLEGEEVQRRQA